MATAVPVDLRERESYLNAGYGIKSWLLTRDHKRIALLYLLSHHVLLLHRRHFSRCSSGWSC